MNVTIARLDNIFRPGMDESITSRLNYYSIALELFSNNPIWGYGIGSWPILIGVGDIRSYPHNIL